MTTLETLVKARESIAERGNWRRGPMRHQPWQLWRATTGHCAAEAIWVAGNKSLTGINALMAALGCRDINELYFFNDTHSHAEVLALFDRAIERQRTIESLLPAGADNLPKTPAEPAVSAA